jgi:hypothetical protein
MNHSQFTELLISDFESALLELNKISVPTIIKQLESDEYKSCDDVSYVLEGNVTLTFTNFKASFLKSHAKISEVVKNVLDLDQSTEEVDIPFEMSPQVSMLVGNYINICAGNDLSSGKEILKPLKSKNLHESIQIQTRVAEDVEKFWYYIETLRHTPNKYLFSLLSSANWMNIVGLVNLASATVAAIIKGESLTSIKGLLDLDPEVNKATLQLKEQNAVARKEKLQLEKEAKSPSTAAASDSSAAAASSG